MLDVAHGLAYLHKSSCLHMDIKVRPSAASRYEGQQHSHSYATAYPGRPSI